MLKPVTETQTQATIILPPGVRPAKACSRDTSRPILCHAYLREREDGWWLLATDAYIAVAIKVQTQGEIVEGYVPFDTLAHMRWGERVVEQLSPTAWRAFTDRGTATHDVGELVATVKKPYPDFEKLGMWEGEPAEPQAELGLNARMTRRLVKALGIAKHHGCRYDLRKPPYWSHAESAPEAMIRVTGGHRYPDRVGLQMPVRLGECS